MCDPSNTNWEAALRDERNDLDPTMACYYIANAQSELARALSASPPDMQCIDHLKRLVRTYLALAAQARLPDESGLDEAEAEETVQSADVAQMHPDRLALMGSGGHETNAVSSPALGRSFGEVTANRAGASGRARTRELSVESIVREDGLFVGANHSADRRRQNGQSSTSSRQATRRARSRSPRRGSSDHRVRDGPRQNRRNDRHVVRSAANAPRNSNNNTQLQRRASPALSRNNNQQQAAGWTGNHHVQDRFSSIFGGNVFIHGPTITNYSINGVRVSSQQFADQVNTGHYGGSLPQLPAASQQQQQQGSGSRRRRRRRGRGAGAGTSGH